MYGMSKSLTAKLQRQQNLLARVVLRTNRLSSAGPLLNELHWLPVASDLEWPASRCQVITFLSDLQENAQNSLFPQPSHLGHVLVPCLRFVSTGPLGPCHYDLGVCFKSSLLLLLLLLKGCSESFLNNCYFSSLSNRNVLISCFKMLLFPAI